MQRVGRIAHRMASEGYEPPAINLVVRVLPRLLARNPMHPNCNPAATLYTEAATPCIQAATPCIEAAPPRTPGARALRLVLEGRAAALLRAARRRWLRRAAAERGEAAALRVWREPAGGELIAVVGGVRSLGLAAAPAPVAAAAPHHAHLPLTPYPSPPQAENLEQWFEAIDSDRSGVIEFVEFTRLMRALRRAIEAGGKTTLGTLTAGLASSVQ
eukprot:scaffold62489_cov28-Phaeocystis_antarctica.AAC.1